jgi:predicted nuclease with TOPRIM domain
MNKDEARQILDYLKRIDESINGPRTRKRPPKDKRPLSDRVDSVEKKVGSLGAKVGSLKTKFGSLETKFGSLETKVDTLGTKVDALDDRVSEVQLGLATLAADNKAAFKRIDDRFEQIDGRFDRIDKRFDAIDVKFKRVDKRFDHVDQKIELARVEVVDLVERVHKELAGRVVDLELPGPGRKGNGGRGSGGVPLAS